MPARGRKSGGSRGGGRTKTSRTRSAGRRSARTASRGARRASRSRSTDGRGGDAVAVLVEQHDRTRKLFQDLAEAEMEERNELFRELADVIAAHSTLEERLLYPEIARVEELSDVAHDSVEEHLIVKRLLADLLEKDLEEAVWDAKRRVLEVELTRHLEEEEGGLFPQARRKLGRDRLAELGTEMVQMFEQLMGSEPRRNVPNETESAPSLSS